MSKPSEVPELLDSRERYEPRDAEYQEGFSMRTVWGALFVGLVMMPGSIFLGLIAGQTLGPAAEWVTIILFVEAARRSFQVLRRQEIFVLFYTAAALSVASPIGGIPVGGGPFTGLMWNQYLVQSSQTEPIWDDIPVWVSPSRFSDAVRQRNLFHPDWRMALGIVVIMQILGRLNWFGMGFLMFRLTSDVERLAFPLAPIAAEGATALAESTTKEESWRWPVFSFAAMLGVIFGGMYVLVPALTGLIMSQPIMILPIPFVDFTSNTENWMPAALTSIGFDLNGLIIGMILPFPLVIGLFAGMVSTSLIGNPILYKLGAFPHYERGTRLLRTKMITDFDFWMSVAVGLAIAVALIGVFTIVKALIRHMGSGQTREFQAITPEERRRRGDIPDWLALALFLVGTTLQIVLVRGLIKDPAAFPWMIAIVFGFVWTPLNSYISARMIGITGMPLVFPYLREASFILSGYPHVDIWFAPIPLADYGPVAQHFRTIELTRTRITGLIKAELLIVPVSLICSLVFWSFFWNIGPIPSVQYPFTAKMWPVAARSSYLIFTANVEENPLLLQALKPPLIAGGTCGGLLLYSVMSRFGLPLTFFYGFVGGVGNFPHGVLPIFIGALLGRYVFRKRFGEERWRRYVPVLGAGFACGMGLTGMIAVALALIAKAATNLPF